jgi:hypothetical protein
LVVACSRNTLNFLRMNAESHSVDAEKLKPVLHLKIEQMNGRQLAVLNRVLLQLEAEEVAGRLGEAFDRDQEEGKMRQIPELVRKHRQSHPYA